MDPSIRPVYKTFQDCVIHVDVYVPVPISSSARLRCPIIFALHAGAWCIGSTRLVNFDQIRSCLSRRWIVLVPEFRLCPQVDIHSGPLTDVRDCLDWVHRGCLEEELSRHSQTRHVMAQVERIGAYGMSSGGQLALGLGFGVPKPVQAILSLYGTVDFNHRIWKLPFSQVKNPQLPLAYINQVYDEKPTPVEGGVSLQSKWRPSELEDTPELDPQSAFCFHHMSKGTLLAVCCPSGDYQAIDPVLNIHRGFPPTCIVHGDADELIPVGIARDLCRRLLAAGVECEIIEIPGENHTFATRMVKGGQTWNKQSQGFDFLERFLRRGEIRNAKL